MYCKIWTESFETEIDSWILLGIWSDLANLRYDDSTHRPNDVIWQEIFHRQLAQQYNVYQSEIAWLVIYHTATMMYHHNICVFHQTDAWNAVSKIEIISCAIWRGRLFFIICMGVIQLPSTSPTHYKTQWKEVQKKKCSSWYNLQDFWGGIFDLN